MKVGEAEKQLCLEIPQLVLMSYFSEKLRLTLDVAFRIV